jgi:group I intron endonuclease
MENNYTVYSHINKINNKIYIGITKQKVHSRWGGKGQGYKDSPRFWNAIQKYGWNNFEHNILFENLTREEACQKEQELIAKYNSTNENFGYNMTSGGEKHYIFTEEVKEKIRQQKIGKNNPQWGKHKTDKEKEEQRLKIREIGKNGGNHCKKVKCVETNIIYYSCQEAARNTGSGRIKQATHIADVCNKKRNKCNGYSWEW